jgi:hypothetical protein
MHFEFPMGYQWLLDQGVAGCKPFSQLQPWYYLPKEECFWVSDVWNNVIDRRLFAYARRQDCDDIACFSVSEDGDVLGVVLIHGWTDNGFDICKEYPEFWDWLKDVINDISEWIADRDQA